MIKKQAGRFFARPVFFGFKIRVNLWLKFLFLSEFSVISVANSFLLPLPHGRGSVGGILFVVSRKTLHAIRFTKYSLVFLLRLSRLMFVLVCRSGVLVLA